ncbi:MAG: hypothetical protein IKD87_06410 [Oscillospiraceae bacterium]|nr:hypothetical protein [Oscillospiraceae bacterium]
MTEEIDVSRTENGNETVSFDMQEWIKQKRAERDRAFRMMDGMAQRIKEKSGDLRAFLDLMVRFPNYSVGNLLLIAAQKPDATDLRAFSEWRSLGTSIKKGQTGILLLERGSEYTRRDGTAGRNYNTKRLFDVSQTRALKNPPIRFPTDYSRLFRAVMEISPCEIVVDEEMNIFRHQDAVFDEDAGNIRIAITNDLERLITPLIREVSKAYMSAGDASPEYMDAAASCIAYAVSLRKGIELGDFSLAESAKAIRELEDVREVKKVLGRIRDVTSSILEDMDIYFRSGREVPVSEAVR